MCLCLSSLAGLLSDQVRIFARYSTKIISKVYIILSVVIFIFNPVECNIIDVSSFLFDHAAILFVSYCWVTINRSHFYPRI